jgi:hypothetical protein
MENSIPDFVKGPYPSVGIKKLIADFKTYLEELEGIAEANETAVGTLETLAGVSIKTLVNDIRAKLKGDYLLSLPVLAIGSDANKVSNVDFDFLIGGVRYTKTAVADGTVLAGDDIPQDKYGAWRLEIGADLTIDIVEATDNATGYDDAELAAAGLPALSENHASMGIVTASNSGGVFDPGTTNLDAVTVTAAYTDGQTAFQAIGAAVA